MKCTARHWKNVYNLILILSYLYFVYEVHTAVMNLTARRCTLSVWNSTLTVHSWPIRKRTFVTNIHLILFIRQTVEYQHVLYMSHLTCILVIQRETVMDFSQCVWHSSVTSPALLPLS